MPLTPYDIHDKEFKRSFRGYDVDEVNDFLDQIIKEFEFLIREKQQLEQQVEELQAELERVMEEQSMTAPVPSAKLQPAQPPQRYQDTQVHFCYRSDFDGTEHSQIDSCGAGSG